MSANEDLVRAGHPAPTAADLQRIYNKSSCSKVDFMICFNVDNATYEDMTRQVQKWLREKGPDSKQYWEYGRNKADNFHLAAICNQAMLYEPFDYLHLGNKALTVEDGGQKRAVMTIVQCVRTIMDFIHQQCEAMEKEPLLRDEATAALVSYKNKRIRDDRPDKFQFGNRNKSPKKSEMSFVKSHLFVLPRSQREAYEKLPNGVAAVAKKKDPEVVAMLQTGMVLPFSAFHDPSVEAPLEHDGDYTVASLQFRKLGKLVRKKFDLKKGIMWAYTPELKHGLGVFEQARLQKALEAIRYAQQWHPSGVHEYIFFYATDEEIEEPVDKTVDNPVDTGVQAET